LTTKPIIFTSMANPFDFNTSKGIPNNTNAILQHKGREFQSPEEHALYWDDPRNYSGERKATLN